MIYMEHTHIKLSIIVPVYKTEQYLYKCLSSILDQKIDKSLYEVIIVNDGSPDNSQNIIDDFCTKYENVRSLKQINQGLSIARTNGLTLARGEYIWFIDSDDWVKDNSIHYILKECTYKPDVVSITYIKDESHTIYPSPYPTNGKAMLQSLRFPNGMVFHIVRRDFLKLHHLTIYPGIYHEDSEFTPRMLYYAKSVRVIPEPLYYMFANPTSITRSINPKKSHDLLIVSNNLYKFKETVTEPSLQKVFSRIISVHINSALANIVKSNKAEQKRFNSALHANQHLFSVLWNGSLKYRIEYIFFKLFPKYYVEAYRMMKRI